MKKTPPAPDCYWIVLTLAAVAGFLLAMPGPPPQAEGQLPGSVAAPESTNGFMYGPNGLIAPAGFRPDPVLRRHFSQGRARLTLLARRFAQGEPVLAEISGVPAAPTLHFAGLPVPLARRPWGYRGLLALAPTTEPGSIGWRLAWKQGERHELLEGSLAVAATAFPRDEVWIEAAPPRAPKAPGPRRTAPDGAALARAKQTALASVGPDRLVPGRAFPTLTMRQSSPFYALRRIVRYRRDGTNRIPLSSFVVPHLGTDLAATRGEPALALAAGLVTFAGEMPFEGNFVVVDHGLGMISYYMHLHLLLVEKGETVRAGSVLGLVGSTGFSSGPHLHVSLRIRGVQVDPLALPSLPIR